MNTVIRKKIVIIISLILMAFMLLFFISPIIQYTYYLPKEKVGICDSIDNYNVLLTNFYEPYSDLIPSSFGCNALNSKIKGENYLFTLESDPKKQILFDASVSEYYVKKDFALPKIDLNNYKCIKRSTLFNSEWRNKNGFFLYEYDESEEVNQDFENKIIAILLKNEETSIDIPLVKVDDEKFIRLYLQDEPIYYIIGITFFYNGSEYFSIGNMDEDHNIIDCYVIS